jgi:hypothetical protein
MAVVDAPLAPLAAVACCGQEQQVSLDDTVGQRLSEAAERAPDNTLINFSDPAGLLRSFLNSSGNFP